MRKIFIVMFAFLLSFTGIAEAQNTNASNVNYATQEWSASPNLFAFTTDAQIYKADKQGSDMIETFWNQNDIADLDTLQSMRISIEVTKKIAYNRAVLKYTLATLLGRQWTQNTASWLDTVYTTPNGYWVPETEQTTYGALKVDSLFYVEYKDTLNVGDKVEIGFSHHIALRTNQKGELKTESYTHIQSKVEAGEQFHTFLDTTLATNEFVTFRINPEYAIHTDFSVQASDGFKVEIFEAPTDSVIGDTLTLLNKNRASDRVTGTVFTKNFISTVGGPGLTIDVYRSGRNNVIGDVITGYWVFDKTKNYVFKITSVANSNNVNAQLQFHSEGY